MLNFGATSNFSNYYRSLPDNHFTDSNITEKYRLASVLLLLSAKQMFKQANKLNNKVSKVDTYYNDKIDVISNVLGMFYLAAQGKDFDNFKSIDTLISKNDSAVNGSGVNISEHPASQEEAEIQESKRSNSNNNNNNTEYDNSKENNVIFGNWEAAAKDFICNMPDYKNVELPTVDNIIFELIDMTNDNIPEIMIYTQSGTSSEGLYAYAIFDRDKYKFRLCDETNSTYNIYPYHDTETNKTVFIGGMFDEDTFADDVGTGDYLDNWFYRAHASQDFMSINKKGILMKYNSICVYPDYGQTSDIEGFDVLNDETAPMEERQKALENLREYSKKIHTRYKTSSLKYCYTAQRFNWYDEASPQAKKEYKNKFTLSYTDTFISKYKKGSHEYYPN